MLRLYIPVNKLSHVGTFSCLHGLNRVKYRVQGDKYSDSGESFNPNSNTLSRQNVIPFYTICLSIFSKMNFHTCVQGLYLVDKIVSKDELQVTVTKDFV